MRSHADRGRRSLQWGVTRKRSNLSTCSRKSKEVSLQLHPTPTRDGGFGCGRRQKYLFQAESSRGQEDPELSCRLTVSPMDLSTSTAMSAAFS